MITRTFDAPRSLVWAAHTKAEHLAEWWGPKGSKPTILKLDLRPGGMFHYHLEFGGTELWGRFVYREITAPERLEFVLSFADAEGNIARNPWDTNWPLETLNVLTLSETGGKTTLTLRVHPINATAEERKTYHEGFKSMEGGFGGTYEQLAEFLATQT
jgi:uncharacterized protein YndB with AHSA1/START domain